MNEVLRLAHSKVVGTEYRNFKVHRGLQGGAKSAAANDGILAGAGGGGQILRHLALP